MADSLNPTLISRFLRWLRADWTRTMLTRRIAAGLLVVLAGIAAVRPDSHGDSVEVVVANRDISPGAALTADDISRETRPAATVPDGAATDLTGLLGARPAGPVRRGEVLTDLRLLGERLTEAAAGPDARIVGVHPADGALTSLVRPGDVVDVVAAPTADPHAEARIVATGGVVVLASGRQHNGADELVLVALPVAAATAVAGATLVESVTLTLH